MLFNAALAVGELSGPLPTFGYLKKPSCNGCLLYFCGYAVLDLFVLRITVTFAILMLFAVSYDSCGYGKYLKIALRLRLNTVK